MKKNKKITSEKQRLITQRRERIIAAASLCFRKHGFYRTGMAEIATTCRLSVGQIYRYFVNKDEIIEAVVRDFMAKKISQRIILSCPLETIGDKLAQRWVKHTTNESEEDDGLMLEVWKEAYRQKNIAKIVQIAERKFHDQSSQALQKQFPFLSDEDAKARVEIMVALCDGINLRKGVAINASERFLKPLYQHILGGLFPINKVAQDE